MSVSKYTTRMQSRQCATKGEKGKRYMGKLSLNFFTDSSWESVTQGVVERNTDTH